ncbi:hypothetical protein NHG97_14730 [Pseudomonas corrugata]|uniref:hypothetical protein n=1 Tax=Pseudomonas corrugata TaxID=47879 RepID=UPI0028C3F223|nr:hypothetical protein [Pseudomonas corrugata]MDU9039950.1 hypothetical protein [Pseudomonas corrugata]
MSEVKKYHVGDSGLIEGEALGRITVYLAADYDRLIDVYLAAGDRAQALATRIHHLEQSEKQAQETVTLALSTGARVALERDALQQRLTVQDQRVDDLGAALKFYADRDHYSTDDELNWDSCSGEPSNILWHESEPWFIEDGSIARAALAEPVPPAGGEPEVVAWRYFPKDGITHPAYTEREAQAIAYDPAPTALVDRAHVTRLQAELKAMGERYQKDLLLSRERWCYGNRADAKIITLQAELTKAREIIQTARRGANYIDAADAFLSNQSAPADKGQLEPVAYDQAKENKLFEAWALTQSDVSLRLCDIGLYYQRDTGLTHDAWQYRAKIAEQPAPVAVVSRDICPNCQGSTYGCATCIPDFTPGNGNRAQRRALKLYGFKVLEEPTLSPNEIKVVPAPTAEPTPTAYDGFDNGID